MNSGDIIFQLLSFLVLIALIIILGYLLGFRKNRKDRLKKIEERLEKLESQLSKSK